MEDEGINIDTAEEIAADVSIAEVQQLAPTAKVGAAGGAAATRLAAQVKKLNEANLKYKNLLKMAKERIQKQEEELNDVRNTLQITLEQTASGNGASDKQGIAMSGTSGQNGNDDQPQFDESATNIVRVCQRVQVEDSNSMNDNETWALIEYEMTLDDFAGTTKRSRRWKKFHTEAELRDYIRRDTGEPLTLPPLSLTPQQSASIQQQTAASVQQAEEEFRRYRVKAELSKKQLESQVRDLQNQVISQQAQRIEAGSTNLGVNKSVNWGNQKAAVSRAEWAAQEAQWKEAYDTLLAENNSLRDSTNSNEGLVASQWRARYENCVKEKESLQHRVAKLEKESPSSGNSNQNDFEMKYRDLKESFRLYRKKAKEVFEAQQQENPNGVKTVNSTVVGRDFLSSSLHNQQQSADAKLSYLKNLLLNYLTAESSVRDHMEEAIGTVLEFSPNERQQIKQKRSATSESWFYSYS
jgi:GRIP domain